MTQIPILFLGDSPSLHTGLARIGRHLASNLSSHPGFRVGYLGRGGHPSVHLPFMQYTFEPSSQCEWGEDMLVDVWNNFVGPAGTPGILFTIWDPSRVAWVGTPDLYHKQYPELANLLMNPSTNLWGYFPIDAEGPRQGGGLTQYLSLAIGGYDRVLAYSRFGKRVLEASLPENSQLLPIDWLPHGLRLDVFQPRDSMIARAQFGWSSEHQVIGCFMANQPRKDWGLWARIASDLHHQIPSARFYCKTDSIDRHWDLRALIEDHGLGEVVVVDLEDRTDVELSHAYSMCDVTILPSLGEGFGYPVAESLACGVPCVVGGYGAENELIPEAGRSVLVVEHESDRLDTRWGMMRPVYNPAVWAIRIQTALDFKFREMVAVTTHQWRGMVEHLDWKKLWPGAWKKWFDQGLAEIAGEVGEDG